MQFGDCLESKDVKSNPTSDANFVLAQVSQINGNHCNSAQSGRESNKNKPKQYQ
jgi:hypothetical protein